ncbi:helix-turn-helix transcriptional regulator [Cytobacillus sp. FSL R5-0569]|uniref:PadR family transcriptional regulator n=1 Tax=Cytobacillus sp. FSL R5-0569 TaxID=2921649 RepID=UPI0030FB75D0
MSIQIFILSKLMEGNDYPYNIKKLISDPIPLDKIRGITESKLYYHFESLAKQGLIEVVEVIKEVKRPDRQVYRITEKGRLELPNKIYKVFTNANTVNEMILGITNLKYVDSTIVIQILEKKLEGIRAIEESRIVLEGQPNVDRQEPAYRFMNDYFSESLQSNIYWLKKLINGIREGEFNSEK